MSESEGDSWKEFLYISPKKIKLFVVLLASSSQPMLIPGCFRLF